LDGTPPLALATAFLLVGGAFGFDPEARGWGRVYREVFDEVDAADPPELE
jgi:hypothetical protein